MSQIEVRILQQDYLLTCPQGKEEALRAAVARVDADMERIRNTGKVRARERVGVLAAVNLAFENTELQAENEALAQSLLHAVQSDSATVDSTTFDDSDIAASSALAPDSVELTAIENHPEVQSLMTELERLLAQREQELLEAQALIERLEAALQVEEKLF